MGSLLRFEREQYTWKAGSSQLLRRKQLVLGSTLFHVGILVIFAGHFVGLLTPIAVFAVVLGLWEFVVWQQARENDAVPGGFRAGRRPGCR